MSFRLTQYPWSVRALVVGVSSAIGAALVWLGLRGDGHVPPPLEPRGYTSVHVCPSAAWALPALVEATHAYAERCVPILELRADHCEGLPPVGVVQVRDHRDQLGDGLQADVGGQYVDRIAHRSDGRGAAYLLDRASVRSCTPAHVLGHIYGFREHATAATSVMADPCGPSYAHLERCE